MLGIPKDCLRETEKSLRHVAMVTKFLGLNKPRSCKYGKKKRKLTKNDIYAVFPVYDGTREQNSSPNLASIVRQCKWPSLSRS